MAAPASDVALPNALSLLADTADPFTIHSPARSFISRSEVVNNPSTMFDTVSLSPRALPALLSSDCRSHGCADAGKAVMAAAAINAM